MLFHPYCTLIINANKIKSTKLLFFKSEHDNSLFNAILLLISEYNTKEMKVKAVVKVFQYIFNGSFWIKLSVTEFTRLTVNEL